MTKAAKKQTLQGEIISNRMNRTVVVKVALMKHHPKYHKRFVAHKHCMAHCEGGEFQVGDIVEIARTRPVSKHKRWTVIRKIK